MANKHGTSFRLTLARKLVDELGWKDGDLLLQQKEGNGIKITSLRKVNCPKCKKDITDSHEWFGNTSYYYCSSCDIGVI